MAGYTMMVDREQIKRRLSQSRASVMSRGHTWDVADVMEVIDEVFGCELEVETMNSN